MAEVLITLGIIGVVAAMTLPTLIQQHQKQVYVTGLKKGLSTVQNMVTKMMADEGASDMYQTSLFDGMCTNETGSCEDAYGNISGLDSIIPKYIKTVKTCTSSIDSECDVEYYSSGFVDNKFSQSDHAYGIYSILGQTRGGIKGYYSSDGMIYYFAFTGKLAGDTSTGVKKVGLVTCIDVNGEKSPNIHGRDLFCFTFTPIYGQKLMTGTDLNSLNHSSSPEYRLMQNGWKMDY